METLIISIFIIGYLAITLEHTLKIDKLIPALAMMAILWALIALNHIDVYEVNTSLKELELSHLDEVLLHHLGKTSEILIFLLGAMTIVEIIDYFNGFYTIKNFIKTKSKKGLLWIFGILAFILSAIIDNLTATIVLITILQKVIFKRETKLWFAGLIIISANAGGAWSPIGDVTTTMLWIGNKVSTGNLILYVLLPSIVCLLSLYLLHQCCLHLKEKLKFLKRIKLLKYIKEVQQCFIWVFLQLSLFPYLKQLHIYLLMLA